MSIPFKQSAICPAIIGRTADLVAISSFIQRTKNNQGQVLLLSGEAGIGKSRLVIASKLSANEQGFLTLQGSCFPSDLSYPYAPLLDLIHTYFNALPAETLGSTVKLLPRELFPLLPYSMQILPELAALPQLPPLEPEQVKRRLFLALTQFFNHLAIKQPILLIIEDLHWCDDNSLEFLHHLARHSSNRPLLLLLTLRSDEIHPTLQHWLAQLDRERLLAELTLARLTRGSVDEMLRTTLNLSLALRKELLDTLYPLTEGNPFFVEELLKSLMLSGILDYMNGNWQITSPGEVHIPRSVQDAVQQRKERLSATSRQVLQLAAIVGRRFDFVLLQQLSGYDELQLLSAMKELIAAQLVVEESAEGFAFRHALTRQAIYADMLARERRVLHGHIAETMERDYNPIPDAYIADLGRHFFEAGQWSKALEYARRAGESAQALHAPQAAAEHYSLALQAMQHLALPPDAAIYRARGHAFEILGKFEPALDDYQLSLQSAQAIHDHHAAWQSLIDLGFLWTGRDYTRGGSYYQQAMDLARTMDDQTILAHSLNHVANWHLNLEQPQEATRLHQEALGIFRAVDGQQGIAETLDFLGMTSYLGGNLAQSVAYYEQSITLFRNMKNYQGLISSLATLIMCSGNYQAETLIPLAMEAQAIIQKGDEALKLARATGQRSGEAYTLMNMGFSLGPKGQYQRALECLQEGMRIAEDTEHHQWMTGIRCALGALYRDLLLHTQAREHLAEAARLAEEIGSHFWSNIANGLLASTCIEDNDLGRAETLLTRTFNIDMPMQTIGQRILWCSYSELALARAHPREALRYVDRLIASTPKISENDQIPRLLQLRGEALMQLKQMGEAKIVLQIALKAAEMQSLPMLTWRIQLLLCTCYDNLGLQEQLTQASAAAQTLLSKLAHTLPPDLPSEQFLARAATVSLSRQALTPLRAEKLAAGGLTRREREIAVLIARGQYNREIAATLTLSERTIETHISNIMFKLNFNSRRQIANWVIEKGLLPGP